MRTVVIGGGASGLMAAITAAAAGDTVAIIEKENRIGRKILATGNGRCNLMNTGRPVYYGDAWFAQSVFENMPVERLHTLFNDMGLTLREEDCGRVYPATGQSSTVLDVLRANIALFGINVQCNKKAEKLILSGKEAEIVCKDGSHYSCDRIIVSGGGKSQPKLGSDGSCYSLLTKIGHRLAAPFPALTQIMTDTYPIRGLSGIRTKAKLTVTSENGSYSTSGELLFTDYGISGVCAMQCARFVQDSCSVVHIDLLSPLDGITAEELEEILIRRLTSWGALSATELLTGLFVPKLGAAIIKKTGIAMNCSISDISPGECKKIVKAACDFTVGVTGVMGFENSQVTAGGILCEDFSPLNMQSKFDSRVFATGELLNVDGDCGGFNLMFAFATGALAGFNMRNV